MILYIVIAIVTFLSGTQSVPTRKGIPEISRNAKGAIVSVVMSDKDGRLVAQGSGFLVSRDGRVVTNYHVIKKGSSAVIKLPDGAFYAVDGILASDNNRDIAVIQAHGENFHALALGDSDRVQVGDEVVAIGSPLSMESTVSNGIVSGIRTFEDKGGKFLQITAPISPGSSGGPLFDMAGEVVGITTSTLRGGENLNFAIPINDAKLLLLPRFSKVSQFPSESDTAKAPSTHDGPTSAMSDQSPTEKQQHDLSVHVGILRSNVSTALLDAYPNGFPFKLRSTERERQEAWAPKFESPKDVTYFNDGLGCVVFLKQNMPSICAPVDVQARLAMEALREDWDNVKNVPERKSILVDALRNSIPMIWAEEKTMYCMLRPEAQYIDLSDSLMSCTTGKRN